jgi:uncharacterized membrane protein YbhN (UPF0104 family)
MKSALFISSRRMIISLIVLLLLAILLLPQIDSFEASLQHIAQSNTFELVITALLSALTFVLSADIYRLLVKHPVSYSELLIAQLATAVTSRIVPIGIGTMGLNAYILKRRKHSLSEAFAVVAANNGLGITGHVLLLVCSSIVIWKLVVLSFLSPLFCY